MKQQLFKKIFYSLVILLINIINFLPSKSLAATSVVQPESRTFSSPIDVESLAGKNFGEILQQMFTWGIGIAGILAVVMLVVGGIEYMGSESMFAKDQGKNRIMAALGGLLIALASILILTTIFGGEGGPFNVNLSF